MLKQLHKVLEVPWVYQLSQVMLAPGAEKALGQMTADTIGTLPDAKDVLDVGCGPASMLWPANRKPLGADINHDYAIQFRAHGVPAVTASADCLPFKTASFDAAWCFGLLHHLDDDTASRTVGEMVRVCRTGGTAIVFDAVMPAVTWRRPVAWAIRRLDRGRHMRSQQELTTILSHHGTWALRRLTYCVLGHEGIVAVMRKPAAPST